MEAQEVKDASNPPELNKFPGDFEKWNIYIEELFLVFRKTLIDSKLTFKGLPLKIRQHPPYKEKHFAFWHLITEGEKEEERTPDLRRCERISWVSWVIQNHEMNKGISSWPNKRGSETHIVLWYETGDYAVILAERNGYFLLKTAYIVDERRKKKFVQEREESKRNKRT